VNRNGESTVPCGAPVLLTTFQDTQPFSLTDCGLSTNPGSCEGIHVYFQELLTQQQGSTHRTLGKTLFLKIVDENH